MTFDRHRQDWDDIAEQDQLWAILSDDTKTRGRWDVGEFFATGDREMDGVMARARSFDRPKSTERALDFGCGVGRVTRAMTRYFDKAMGLDISATMVASAMRLNEAYFTCDFAVNDRADLGQVGDEHFDFVYSSIVLQHLPHRETIEGYVREFVRVLARDGLLCFQLPSSIPLRYRLQPRRRAYSALRRVGVSPAVLRHRLGLHPIQMNAVPESRITEILASAGGEILAIDRTVIDPFRIESRTYWITRP